MIMKETDVMPGKSAEESLDPEDWESMRMLGHRILDDMMDYLETLRDRPAWQHAPVDVKAHFAGSPPLSPKHQKRSIRSSPGTYCLTRSATTIRVFGAG